MIAYSDIENNRNLLSSLEAIRPLSCNPKIILCEYNTKCQDLEKDLFILKVSCYIFSNIVHGQPLLALIFNLIDNKF